MTARSFAFVPRYRGLARGSIAAGGAMSAVAAILGFVTVPLVSGVLGIALGVAYLASPTWRITVTVDDAGLNVGAPGRLRFRLAWGDVVRVVASPTREWCFVDGGAPERSLLVPGDGAPAPYDIADRRALVDAILAQVPPGKVTTAATLDQAREGASSGSPPSP